MIWGNTQGGKEKKLHTASEVRVAPHAIENETDHTTQIFWELSFS